MTKLENGSTYAIPPSAIHGCITIMPCEVCLLFNQVMPKVPKEFYESKLRSYEVSDYK